MFRLDKYREKAKRGVPTRAVESESLKVGKSLKIGKNRKKSDKNRIKSDKKSSKIGNSEISDLI